MEKIRLEAVHLNRYRFHVSVAPLPALSLGELEEPPVDALSGAATLLLEPSQAVLVRIRGLEIAIRSEVRRHPVEAQQSEGKGYLLWWEDSNATADKEGRRHFWTMNIEGATADELWTVLTKINTVIMLRGDSLLRKATPASKPHKRPVGPRRLPSALHRNSLCLVDSDTGEVIRVVNSTVRMSTPPQSMQYENSVKHTVTLQPHAHEKHDATRGQELAALVDGISQGMHPRPFGADRDPRSSVPQETEIPDPTRTSTLLVDDDASSHGLEKRGRPLAELVNDYASHTSPSVDADVERLSLLLKADGAENRAAAEELLQGLRELDEQLGLQRGSLLPHGARTPDEPEEGDALPLGQPSQDLSGATARIDVVPPTPIPKHDRLPAGHAQPALSAGDATGRLLPASLLSERGFRALSVATSVGGRSDSIYATAEEDNGDEGGGWGVKHPRTMTSSTFCSVVHATNLDLVDDASHQRVERQRQEVQQPSLASTFTLAPSIADYPEHFRLAPLSKPILEEETERPRMLEGVLLDFLSSGEVRATPIPTQEAKGSGLVQVEATVGSGWWAIDALARAPSVALRSVWSALGSALAWPAGLWTRDETGGAQGANRVEDHRQHRLSSGREEQRVSVVHFDGAGIGRPVFIQSEMGRFRGLL